jgi:hypothetical protein
MKRIELYCSVVKGVLDLDKNALTSQLKGLKKGKSKKYKISLLLLLLALEFLFLLNEKMYKLPKGFAIKCF